MSVEYECEYEHEYECEHELASAYTYECMDVCISLYMWLQRRTEKQHAADGGSSGIPWLLRV